MSKISDQLYGIWTVYKRQNLRLITTKSQIVSMLVMPLMWLLIIGQSFDNMFGSNPLGRSMSGGLDYITFMTPGILIMITMFSSLFGIVSLFYDRDSGYLKNYLISPISNNAIVVGYSLGIYTKVFIQVIIVLLMALGIGADISLTPSNIAAVFLYPIFTTFFLTGLAIFLASKAPNVETFQSIIMPVSMPLMFLSPIMYPIDVLPDYFKWIAEINPLTFGVEGLRAALFGNDFVSTATIDYSLFNDHIAIFNAALLFVVGLIFLIFGGNLFLKSLDK